MLDGKGIICPFAFVEDKQGLMKNKSKEFLFDDDISLYNFTSYLDNQNILYQSIELADCVKIKVVGDKA